MPQGSQKEKIFSIYQKLFAFFGPQQWWPAKTPFEVVVGAILTQNTNWANVEKAGKLFGWEPRVSLSEGIANLVDWYNAERSWVSQIKTE